ncbi:MAG TPA: holo-ACP synthase [Gemmatimonadaceae bacterium]|jgi:holo-[acyl-carrier protein] synthase|nr:holo-ACP synthase [Gemmatimonadaceae bacterium]
MIIGLGLDLVEISRVKGLLQRHGSRALTRFFTAREAAYADTHTRPERHFAARIAAKEAAYKALAPGGPEARGIGWTEIEVVSSDGVGPTLLFHGRAARVAAVLGVGSCLLTLTHTDTTAAAVVVLQRP